MSQLLKQSTTVTVKVGPYLDASDAVTEETALTPGIELSKNGGTFAARNSATSVSHDAEGWYDVELDGTDTGTLGRLVLKSHDSATHLPVWHEYTVVPANVHDSLVGDSDKLQVDTTQIGGTTQTANDVGGDVETLITRVPQTLNLTASGNIGVDWANVENPATAVDLAATDIQLCDTVTTNSDMRGTDNALLASSAPTNWGSLSITAGGLVDITQAAADKAWSTTTRALTDKAGFEINGTITTLDGLNNIAAADVWSVTLTELSADPGASPNASGAVLLPYMAIRNKRDTTSSSDEIHNNAGTVLLSATVSDDGTVFSKAKYT